LKHGVGVAVRRIDDDRVHAGVDEGARARKKIARRADGRRDAQPTGPVASGYRRLWISLVVIRPFSTPRVDDRQLLGLLRPRICSASSSVVPSRDQPSLVIASRSGRSSCASARVAVGDDATSFSSSSTIGTPGWKQCSEASPRAPYPRSQRDRRIMPLSDAARSTSAACRSIDMFCGHYNAAISRHRDRHVRLGDGVIAAETSGTRSSMPRVTPESGKSLGWVRE
jgi:hypothetical protein